MYFHNIKTTTSKNLSNVASKYRYNGCKASFILYYTFGQFWTYHQNTSSVHKRLISHPSLKLNFPVCCGLEQRIVCLVTLEMSTYLFSIQVGKAGLARHDASVSGYLVHMPAVHILLASEGNGELWHVWQTVVIVENTLKFYCWCIGIRQWMCECPELELELQYVNLVKQNNVYFEKQPYPSYSI